jgi:hypothetical protein
MHAMLTLSSFTMYYCTNTALTSHFHENDILWLTAELATISKILEKD